MLKLKTLVSLGSMMPTQWEGETEDGKSVYKIDDSQAYTEADSFGG